MRQAAATIRNSMGPDHVWEERALGKLTAIVMNVAESVKRLEP